MKKNILSYLGITMLLLGFLFTASSCDGDPGPMGPPGESTQWAILTMDVDESKWQWDPDDECYYYEFRNVSQLNRNVVENGATVAAVLLDGTYRPLPFISNFYDGGNYITETINYEYGINFIRFNVTANDLFDNTPNTYLPPSRSFKVTLMW
ncbi:hypothetical protein M2132_001575 [Dysgonomonas sp. PH5-45]|uniref:hypothetical protein n=1 Tax=unclassified Dysgonomonas TaxID=2630389 RepID=UPI0024759C66|nr:MULTISPECIES: hypothetical protein [unclassified Dysgonomonas]MDH6355237.1 hypothetical protein [Dysgonomonas sp. PH5-45]MDH6388140.1 hypothetical protein [Dysgonomonas sp. PH5-37]